MSVYSVHWHQDILRLTAQELLARYDAQTLPHVLVLMPNRRSCVAMREAFASLHAEPMFLPRIVPLGDAESELLFAFARGGDVAMEIPPAMGRWQQRLLLAELVRAFEFKRTGKAPVIAHVLALVEDIIAIHDNLLREGVDISTLNLHHLALADSSQHWQVNAEFLDLLFSEWPFIEKEKGMVTRAGREQMVLRAITHAWREQPPVHPVWLVGSTGSMAAVRALMGVVHALPQGAVVLPVLDGTLLKTPVSIGHAQYYLHASLEAMGNPDITWLGAPDILARQHLWAGTGSDAAGIERVTCRHEEEEAGIIGLMVREALEDSNKRVAVITPSPALMERIRLHLRRMDIRVSTPQGQPLAHSAAGRAWCAILECLRASVDVLSLLELLHQEAVHVEAEAQEWQSFLRAWRTACRGVQPRQRASERLRALGSTYPIAASVARVVHDMEGLHQQSFRLAEWIGHITALVKELAPLSVAGHEAVAALMEELASASGEMRLDVEDAAALLREGLHAPLRMPDMAAHPRVFVLSPMEARLHSFERVILAGFNEGDWPVGYQPSPWLNLGQRGRLGMTPPEAHATLAAHDIQMLGMAQELFITRSLKREGSPTQPSRYLVKLEAQLERTGVTLQSRPWAAWWHALHDAAYQPIAAEAPNPPASARPQWLRVTSLRRLFTDPYALYGEYVLGLRVLEDFDKAPDAASFGSLVHKLIQEMIEHSKSPEDGAWLLERTAHLEGDARLAAFWLPRIRKILQFVASVHRARGVIAPECEMPVTQSVGPVELKGKIDRLETRSDGYSIHDFKTGGAPSAAEMKQGLEPQLIAYALMLCEQTGRAPEDLVYWALPKARHSGSLVSYLFADATLEQHMHALREALGRMVSEGFAFHALDDAGSYSAVSRNDEWAA